MSLAAFFKAFPGFPMLFSVLLLVPMASRVVLTGPFAQRGRKLIIATIGTAAVLTLVLAFANLLVPDYVDNVEPAVVGNAWIWWHGGQLYPSAGAGIGVTELRGLLYGPLAFILNGIAPMLLGPSILISKLPAIGMFLGLIALTWLACRRAGSPPNTAFLAASAMTALLGISEAPYWVRGDIVLMLIATVSVWLTAQTSRQPLRMAILLGLLAGTASAIKLHGAAYVAPACLLAALDATGWLTASGGRSGSWKWGILAAGLVAFAAPLAVAWPFLLHGISLDVYVVYLKLAANHGVSALAFFGNLCLLLAVGLPILVLAVDACSSGVARFAPRWLVLASATFTCAIIVALIAGKPGAGYPHLLPFAPYAALLFSQIMAKRTSQPASSPRLLIVGVLFCVAFCLPVLVRAGTFASRSTTFATLSDANRQVQDVIQQYPGESVAVGYGGDSFLDVRLSYLRILPVFSAQPLLYDSTAMDDLWEGGVDRKIALREIDRCGIRVWLIPGDEPFTISNYYGGSTFSDAFRALFEARYQRVISDGPFRVWVCRATPTG